MKQMIKIKIMGNASAMCNTITYCQIDTTIQIDIAIILKGIEKQLEDDAVIGFNQNGLMRGKSNLPNLI